MGTLKLESASILAKKNLFLPAIGGGGWAPLSTPVGPRSAGGAQGPDAGKDGTDKLHGQGRWSTVASIVNVVASSTSLVDRTRISP